MCLQMHVHRTQQSKNKNKKTFLQELTNVRLCKTCILMILCFGEIMCFE